MPNQLKNRNFLGSVGGFLANTGKNLARNVGTGAKLITPQAFKSPRLTPTPANAARNFGQGAAQTVSHLAAAVPGTGRRVQQAQGIQSVANQSLETPGGLAQIQKPTTQATAGQQAAGSRPTTSQIVQPVTAPPDTTQTSGADPGFASSDPAVQAQIAAMTEQAGAVSNVPTETTQTDTIQIAPQNDRLTAVQSQLAAIEQQRSDLQNTLLNTMQPSAEEQSIQQQIADLVGSTNLGISGLEGQGRAIPKTIVRGRQGQLLEQGNIQLQTLEAQLGNLQASRQAQMNAALTQLGFANDELENVRSEVSSLETPEIFQVGDALIQRDPITGELTEAYRSPTGGPAPVTLSQGQSLVDPTTGEVIAQAPSDPLDIQKQALEIKKLQQEISGGGDLSKPLTIQQIKDLGLPTNMFGITTGRAMELLQSGAVQTSEDQLAVEARASALAKVNQIESILNSENFNDVVGPLALSRFTLPQDVGKKRALIGNILNLTSAETLNSLLNLKKQGGTLGALSQTELEILQNSASLIDNWAKKDEDGNVVGFSVDRASFKAELTRLRDLAQKAVDNSQAPPPRTVDELLSQNPEVRSAVQNMLNQNATEEEVLEFYFPGSFNSDLDTSQNGLGSLSARYESGGSPGAIGYDSTGGYSYGTYQLAHNNALDFVQRSPYAQEFAGMTFNSPEFQQKWKEVAQKDPQGFEKSQHDYIEATHFTPQMNLLAQNGYNVGAMSPVLQDVVWSVAVQHGPSSNIILTALNRMDDTDTEADLIADIYNLRWNNGAGFASSTPQVQQSVFNRFFGQNGELNQALSKLA